MGTMLTQSILFVDKRYDGVDMACKMSDSQRVQYRLDVFKDKEPYHGPN